MEGRPCAHDEGCGPDHVCALGYCRAELDDALAGCSDGHSATGEWCYPLSRRFELPLGEAKLRDMAWGDLDGNGLDDALILTDAGAMVHVNLGGGFNTDPLDVRLTPASLAPLGLPTPITELTLPILGRRLAVGDLIGGRLPDVAFTLEVAVEVPPELEPLRAAVEARLWLVDNRGDSVSEPIAIPGTDPLGAGELAEGGLQTGDFDGDGRDDLLIATVDGEGAILRWLRGSDAGPLPPQRLPLQDLGPIAVA
ncbi:MAG: hypothetical protein KDK70_11380, partial [Myxococcales bacterium]|nr:hypothetical protein [Myxococcales bacterium]